MKLIPDIHNKITALSNEGDALSQEGCFQKATEKFKEALALLPEPLHQWEASTWLLTAIGDNYFLQENYGLAYQALLDTMRCPDALGNPFIHLRLGQVCFELEKTEQAVDELMRAYMGEGIKIFEGEDSKYYELIRGYIGEAGNQ